MARSSPKKPSPPKCRNTGANLEGKDWVRIGGNKWLREAAVKEGKFIPIEHREGHQAKAATKPAKQAEAPEAPAEETSTIENAETE